MQFFFDNINYKVVDDLRVSIRKGTKLSIASACFSIYAFEELKSQLQDIEQLRFIFTAPSFLKDGASRQRREFYIPRIDRERTLYGSQFEVRLRNQLTQKAIAIECCISEGQNLQDCDCLINYDIHWNPVRIIQRFVE